MKKTVCLHDQIDEKKLIICPYTQYMTFRDLNHRVDKKAFYILYSKKMFFDA